MEKKLGKEASRITQEGHFNVRIKELGVDTRVQVSQPQQPPPAQTPVPTPSPDSTTAPTPVSSSVPSPVASPVPPSYLPKGAPDTTPPSPAPVIAASPAPSSTYSQPISSEPFSTPPLVDQSRNDTREGDNKVNEVLREEVPKEGELVREKTVQSGQPTPTPKAPEASPDSEVSNGVWTWKDLQEWLSTRKIGVENIDDLLELILDGTIAVDKQEATVAAVDRKDSDDYTELYSLLLLHFTEEDKLQPNSLSGDSQGDGFQDGAVDLSGDNTTDGE